METALQFYTLAKDYLSLVRVFCYCDNLDKVTNSLTAYKKERQIANTQKVLIKMFRPSKNYPSRDTAL
jgi:hypothetical protein